MKVDGVITKLQIHVELEKKKIMAIIEAVHLLASFAIYEAKVSQLCSDVRQTCYRLGKAAPALRQVSQKLRH